MILINRFSIALDYHKSSSLLRTKAAFITKVALDEIMLPINI